MASKKPTDPNEPKKPGVPKYPFTLTSGAPKDAVKREFGKRLYQFMLDRGWNQSELARRAATRMPDGTFGRDNVSVYIRGVSLPGPVHLRALSEALGIEPGDLLPYRATSTAERMAPEIDVKDTGSGEAAWLRINKAVSWPVALKIMALLKE